MFRFALIVLFFSSFSIANEYQEWLKSQNTQYSNYKKSLDEEFSNMLKKDWEEFKTLSTPSPYKKPKPVVIPSIKKVVKIPAVEIKKSPTVAIPKIKKISIPKPQKVVKKVLKKEKIVKDFYTTQFDFYSVPISIQYDKKTFFTKNTINKNTISEFWDMISNTNYKKLIKQIKATAGNLKLNDWAKYQFIHKLGLNIFKQDNNKANLFTWFILIKMNYDVKVGYNTKHIYLMSTMQHSLYQVSFFTLKKKKYYILTPNGKVGNIGSIYTYAGDYPKATNKLSFAIFDEIQLYNHLKNKTLSFEYNGKQHAIDAQYSSDLIDFYKTFPQSDYNIYFNTKNSTLLSNSMLVKLAPLVKGKSEIEAVNLLLRFVQTSFKYKTDQKQFDYEKVMFPEETINYPYSDCEDRSIMFSYLVKNLLKLHVIGIQYKDHIATAVSFSSKVSGANFKYRGKVYTISDPTYIKANAGMVMPQYKNSKFKVISL
ncbi:MAG: hypothetical protein CSA86_04810 [Arcobacter sp.]|nr:MAG: hypothetical protein CSA86_04810 [Arcobacter sp.]